MLSVPISIKKITVIHPEQNHVGVSSSISMGFATPSLSFQTACSESKSARSSVHESSHGARSFGPVPFRRSLATLGDELLSVTVVPDHKLIPKSVPLPKIELLFRSLVEIRWLKTLVIEHERWYFVFVFFVCFLLVIVMSSTWTSHIGVSSVTILLAVVFLLCEATRFDRFLSYHIVTKFEFFVLVLSMLSYMVFGVWSMIGTTGAASSKQAIFDASCGAYSWLALHVPIVLSDAAPETISSVKTLLLLVGWLNSIRVFCMESFAATALYKAVPVCWVYCTDTRILCLSALFQVFLFQSSFLFHHFFRSNTCAILSVLIGPFDPIR